jgi:chromosome segregation ATPase
MLKPLRGIKMNQETMKLVTAKIEKTLESARILKSEKADLEAVANGLRENLKEKDKIIEELNSSKEQLLSEIRSLQGALNERDKSTSDLEGNLIEALDKLESYIKEQKIETENNNTLF